MKIRPLVILILIFLCTGVYAQTRIEVLNANKVQFSEDLGADIKRLIGDVQFKHDDALMYCDSAYLNQKDNSLRAFSRVHIVQEDSLDLFGDYLFYNGNQKVAKVRNNVRLIHKASTLKTDSLDFDRKRNIGHYFNWGYIHDKDNDLQSIEGYYYSDFKDYYAVDSVKLVNPDYIIYSDSLRYNTGTDISYFYGATDIENDSNYIYCEYGEYDTQNDVAQVSKNTYIISKEKKLNGDSIFYDRNIGFGKALGNVCLRDTSANINISGEYAFLFEQQDSAYVTDKALLTKYGDTDTLYLHADTLLLFTVYDTIAPPKDTLNAVKPDVLDDTYQSFFLDSMIYDGARRLNLAVWQIEQLQQATLIEQDSLFRASYLLDTIRNIIAFHQAQIFARNIQVRSDSIAYSSRDSVAKFFASPIIWSEDKQITAEYVEMMSVDNQPTEMFLQQSAFIVMQDDSVRFNQISGKDMRVYFNKQQELYKLDVLSHAKSVFFAREEEQKETQQKGDLVGVNNTESTEMTIYFKNNEPDIINLKWNTKGVLNPVDYVPLEETKLSGFNWHEAIRPQSKEDIFIWKIINNAEPDEVDENINPKE